MNNKSVQHRVAICLMMTVGLLVPWTAHAITVTVPDFTGRDPTEHPILAPCSRYDDRYDYLGFRYRHIEEWSDNYHNTVNGVLEEYLEPSTIECDAENYETLSEAGDALTTLATALPTWNDPDVPLSRFDTPRVLLEYLRVYECALFEFDEFIYYDTWLEEYEDQGPVDFLKFFLSDLMRATFDRADIIQRERAVARNTLHRVITIMGAFDRLRPLDAELECMQRFSLDMRNIAALSAEASACLPRVWNAKDTLRDFDE